ncbi:Uncharacterised protein [Mycobacteroides abscessus subsp. abscessus]|nr:Uncharacterised protein [Mycobacteroides abscessus subsp. abscessus]
MTWRIFDSEPRISGTGCASDPSSPMKLMSRSGAWAAASAAASRTTLNRSIGPISAGRCSSRRARTTRSSTSTPIRFASDSIRSMAWPMSSGFVIAPCR